MQKAGPTAEGWEFRGLALVNALELGGVQDCAAAALGLCPVLDTVGDVGLCAFGAAFTGFKKMDVGVEVDDGDVVEG